MIKTLRQIERLKEILFILIKYGFADLVESTGLEKYVNLSVASEDIRHLSRSERIRKSIEELGPTFIKMAQILSTRPDLIPLDLAEEFAKLQDRVDPVPFEEIEPLFVEEFGKSSKELFKKELELVASASLGQVYKGILSENGETVAVKVLKPRAKEIIKTDLELLRKISQVLEERLKNYGIESPQKIINEFEKTLYKELDYTIEALNLKRFARNFEGEEKILVPKLYEKYSSSKILTVEYIDGIKVSDIHHLERSGIDPKSVAKNGFELFCRQIFEFRFFHADPHPGNIFVLANNKIAFLDFGMMGSISEKDRRYFVDMIYYVVKEEEEKAAMAILQLARIENENLDKDAFAKDMGDIIRTYFYGSLKEIKLKNLLTDIVSLMSQYRVYFKENNYLLVKALITIEGVGKRLDPEFNAAKEIEPYIRRFYKEFFSLRAFLEKTEELPKEIADFFRGFPQDIKALIEKIKSGELKIEFEHLGLEKMEETLEKSANRLSIAIIIAAILIGSALIVLAKTPPLVRDIPILGIAGFVVAVVMGVILIHSIYKRGKL